MNARDTRLRPVDAGIRAETAERLEVKKRDAILSAKRGGIPSRLVRAATRTPTRRKNLAICARDATREIASLLFKTVPCTGSLSSTAPQRRSTSRSVTRLLATYRVRCGT
ncbi:hypothetical protein [Alicyclobacillus sacchari]|uniref:hypothetical protein n=1 Tax=Alicyclobacillus sacchari TaxID=392010 RepID=UPI0024E15CC1|nr:hypothetical protein [Alicyclobacillus sacchari]